MYTVQYIYVRPAKDKPKTLVDRGKGLGLGSMGDDSKNVYGDEPKISYLVIFKVQYLKKHCFNALIIILFFLRVNPHRLGLWR